ncbi:uncharacterized protein LOC112094152, partial [Morus notabilis]|uniref:uncharacterized protein LOC112094152 n=1 Tax=Morus notabilis TaxID=981085 RepID=UPI000CED0B01
PSNSRHRGHPRLNRRLGDKFRPPNFDPLVAKIERYTGEKGLKVEGDENSAISTVENSTFFGEAVDADKYFSNEGRLNITLRLVILFPLLDKAPQDGVISPLELHSWIRDLAVERLNYRTQKELASHDRNGDKAICFREYLPQFSDEDI